MKVCIVGTGRRAKQLCESLPIASKVEAVVSHSIERSKEFASEFNAIPYDSVRNVKDVDYFIVATKIENLHAAVLKCLDHKKPIFIEKPGSEKHYQLHEILLKSKLDNIKIHVAYPWMCASVPEKCGNILRRYYSDITSIDVTWNKHYTNHQNLSLNLLVHPLAWLYQYFDEIFVLNSVTKGNSLNFKCFADKIEVNISISINEFKKSECIFEFKGARNFRVENFFEDNLIQKQLVNFEQALVCDNNFNNKIPLKILSLLERM